MNPWSLLSRLLDYGTLLVLILLCGYYSFATWERQQPESPAAGRQLARAIVDQHGNDARVLILVRKTTADEGFAIALRDELNHLGASVIDTASLASPFAANARKTLKQLPDLATPIDAIATHHPGSQWGPLKPKKLVDMSSEIPALEGVHVHIPASYMWPTFFTRRNLLNIINVNAEVFIMAIGMTMVIITTGSPANGI